MFHFCQINSFQFKFISKTKWFFIQNFQRLNEKLSNSGKFRFHLFDNLYCKQGVECLQPQGANPEKRGVWAWRGCCGLYLIEMPCPLDGTAKCRHEECQHLVGHQKFSNGAVIKKPPSDLSKSVKSSLKKNKIVLLLICAL